MRWRLREEGKCLFCKKPYNSKHYCLGKGHAYYIDVCLVRELDIFYLNLGVDVGDIESPIMASTLGSIISSLYKEK